MPIKTNMGIVELRLSMLATLTIIIGLSTLVLTGIMLYFGVFNIIAVGVIVVGINIAQWLFAPYLLGFVYKIRKITAAENPQLHQIVNNLSQKCHIKVPELMPSSSPRSKRLRLRFTPHRQPSGSYPGVAYGAKHR